MEGDSPVLVFPHHHTLWCCLTPVSRLGCVLQKLLLVSLLQGAGGLPGSGTSQNASANVAVGASPPTTQASVSNGTNQTGNTHGAVMSRGAEKESQGSHSVRPLLAAAPIELPAASTSSPSNYPTEPVALGSAGHKVGIIICNPPHASILCRALPGRPSLLQGGLLPPGAPCQADSAQTSGSCGHTHIIGFNSKLLSKMAKRAHGRSESHPQRTLSHKLLLTKYLES